MKITCNREKLLHAFQTVAAIAPARSPKPDPAERQARSDHKTAPR